MSHTTKVTLPGDGTDKLSHDENQKRHRTAVDELHFPSLVPAFSEGLLFFFCLKLLIEIFLAANLIQAH